MTSINTNIGALVAQKNMDQNTKSMDQALERISDFGGKIANDERGTDKPFVDGTYVPVPFHMNTASSSTTKTTEGQTNESDTDAAILNEITFAETLGDLPVSDPASCLSRRV